MTFTKEQLQKIIETDHVQCGDAAALARELLESRAERDADKKVIVDSVVLFETLRQHIAELEARTVTVKLPKRATADRYVDDDFDNSDLAAIYNACRRECEVKIKDACAAAGINLTVEG